MDIFSPNNEVNKNRLKEFQKEDLLFTPIKNSTCCVEAKLTNVKMEEQEIIKTLKPSKDIPIISSNWGIFEYKKSTIVKPKKKKTKKLRRVQGSGKVFNSCIQLYVISELNANKIYKIKLFRNGVIQIPGVLQEDLSDAMTPIQKVIDLIQPLFSEKITLEYVYSVMKNYKFQMQENIDLRKLHSYFDQKIEELIHIKLEIVEQWLRLPAFRNTDFSPVDSGWASIENTNYNLEFDFDHLLHLMDLSAQRDTYIKLDDLKNIIQESGITEMYNNFLNKMELMKRNFIALSAEIIESCAFACFYKKSKEICKKINGNPYSNLSQFSYKPEKYAGMLIYIKTPLPEKPNKRTTIKVFASGKINIDGATNIESATYIYWWLNNVFSMNPDILIDPDYYPNSSDSEFSESAENSETLDL